MGTASAETSTVMGTAATAKAAAGMGAATAKTAAVRTGVAVPANAAEPCLDTVDVVVDQGTFRTAPRAHRVVFIHYEAL
jgi:hypothetical protein